MRNKNFSSFVVLLLAFVMLLSFSACEKGKKEEVTKEPETRDVEVKPVEGPETVEEPEIVENPEIHAISFNANGGRFDFSLQITNAEGKVDELPIPTKDGAEFDGWYVGDEKVTADTVFTDTTEVVARWIEKTPEKTPEKSSEKAPAKAPAKAPEVEKEPEETKPVEEKKGGISIKHGDGGHTSSGGGDTPSGGGDTPSGGNDDTPSGGNDDTPSGGDTEMPEL